MTISINFVAICSPGGAEDRAILDLLVNYNGKMYNWKTYSRSDYTGTLDQYITEITPRIQAEIDHKESIWQSMGANPTRSVVDETTGQMIQQPINHDEIVKPDIPDYYALRRAAYPSVADQLGAYWKGTGNPEYETMSQKIQSVKQQYPKPPYISD
jgi:hypothetical protein